MTPATRGSVLRGVHLPGGGEATPVDVVIEAGQISEIVASGSFEHEEGEFDSWPLHGKLVLPGLVDLHVRYPHAKNRGEVDFASGSEESARGGATTVLCVASSAPWVSSASELLARRALAQRSSLVSVGLFANAVVGKVADLHGAADHCVGFRISLGPVDGDRGVVAEHERRSLFELAARTGKVMAVHATDPSVLLAAAKHAVVDAASFARAQPPSAEIAGCEMAIRLAAQTGARIHLLHLSTAGAVDCLEDAKARGLPVTGATSPHYLSITAEDVDEGGPALQCIPSIKSSLDRARLREGVRSGTIDALHSDHMTSDGEARRSFVAAPSGLPTARGFVGALLALVDDGVLSGLDDLIERACRAPARIFGLRPSGSVVPGVDADLAVIDLARSEAPVSGPFADLPPALAARLFGRGTVVRTLVGGRTVWAQPG